MHGTWYNRSDLFGNRPTRRVALRTRGRFSINKRHTVVGQAKLPRLFICKMEADSSVIAQAEFERRGKLRTKDLIRSLRFLSEQPSSFVLQQMRVAREGKYVLFEVRHILLTVMNQVPDDEKVMKEIRQLYKRYVRRAYNSPALIGTLQTQVTLQCLSNLSKDGQIKAEQRILELEEELQDLRDSVGRSADHRLNSRAAVNLDTRDGSGTEYPRITALIEAPGLHNSGLKRKRTDSEDEFHSKSTRIVHDKDSIPGRDRPTESGNVPGSGAARREEWLKKEELALRHWIST